MALKLQKYQKKINCTDESTSLIDNVKVTKLQIKSRYSGIIPGYIYIKDGPPLEELS